MPQRKDIEGTRTLLDSNSIFSSVGTGGGGGGGEQSTSLALLSPK